MCTWSGIRWPSSIRLSFCIAKRRRTSPRYGRSWPNKALRRPFGMNTTWYLHSHREWHRLSNSSIVARPSVCLAAHGSERHDGPPNMSNFCCLPGIAGGLPLFIQPDQAEQDSESAHEIEDGAPAVVVRDRAHDRAEQSGREILRGIEDRRSRPTLVGGKPGRHQPRVAGKRRRLGRSDEEAEDEQDVHGRRRAEHRRAALEQGEQGPDDDAGEVDHLGAEAVEQPAARDLADDVGPAEG